MLTSGLSMIQLIAAHFLCIMCLLCAIYCTYFNRVWYKIKEGFVQKLNIATIAFALACICASVFNFLIVKSIVLLIMGIGFGLFLSITSRNSIMQLHKDINSYKK